MDKVQALSVVFLTMNSKLILLSLVIDTLYILLNTNNFFDFVKIYIFKQLVVLLCSKEINLN